MPSQPQPAGSYVMGIDFGTESVRVGIFTLAGQPVTFAAHPYPTNFPRSGWAEQSPHDWWSALTQASRQAVAQSGLPKEAIAGVAADCTSCTVVSLDANFQPLRPALLWMDVRSAAEARAIAASGHRALKYNGYGNVSAASVGAIQRSLLTLEEQGGQKWFHLYPNQRIAKLGLADRLQDVANRDRQSPGGAIVYGRQQQERPGMTSE